MIGKVVVISGIRRWRRWSVGEELGARDGERCDGIHSEGLSDFRGSNEGVRVKLRFKLVDAREGEITVVMEGVWLTIVYGVPRRV